MQEKLIVKGARQHNLKNITVEIPRDKLVVITGLSGSGKSSLAFDTIYAEGQRRYVESLSAYARQFLGQMDKPEVDYIEGLSPAISIDQKTTSRNPRSTVGTVTEIYDYLRLLFARVGEPHCPCCGELIEQQTVQQIVDRVLEMEQGTKFMIMAPLVRGRKGEHVKILDDMRRAGYVRMYVDGEVRTLDEEIKLEKNKKHSLSVVIDRLAVREGIQQRLSDSVETALKLADGFVEVATLGDKAEVQLFSEHFACNECGISLPAIEPRLFSFNNPYGACPVCTGLGMNMEFDKALIIPDGSKTFAEGVIASLSNNMNSYRMKQLGAVLSAYGYDFDSTWDSLPEEVQRLLWEGTGEQKYSFWYENLMGETRLHETTFDGILPIMKKRYREAFSDSMRQDLEEFMTSTPCPECHGSRLKPEVLSILVGGKNICEVTALTVNTLFISDVEPIAQASDAQENHQKGMLAGLAQAEKQNAFCVWNHPHWYAQQPQEVKWHPEHEAIFKKGYMHGIEVYNSCDGFCMEAFQWALDRNMTIICGTDVHTPMFREYNFQAGELRPVTLIFAKEKSKEGIREALENRRTAVFADGCVYGSEELLTELVDACLTVDSVTSQGKTVHVNLKNNSSIPFVLKCNTSATEVAFSRFKIVHPFELHTCICRALVYKSPILVDEFTMTFELDNFYTAPGKKFSYSLKIQKPE